MVKIIIIFQIFIIGLGQSQLTTEELIGDLGCSGCHSGIPIESNVINKIPDLTFAGQQYDPGYLFEFLLNPRKVLQNIGYSRMPDFHLSEGEALALVLFLIEQIPGTQGLGNDTTGFQKRYLNVKAAYPEINASVGKNIYISLNCMACHKNRFPEPAKKKIAPDLSFEGERVKKEWLMKFLRKPTPIRPFGYYPGTGSRMPDFRLNAKEVEILTNYLMGNRRENDRITDKIKIEQLSAFSMKKAEILLKEKLSCLGCHQLGDSGGKIGPNLSNVRSRLKPSYVYEIIQNPVSVLPGTTMPKIVLPPKTLNLIVNYLLQQEVTTEENIYLSTVDHPIYIVNDEENKEVIFVKYCASCHGVNGDGNGFNSKYLPVQPTNHRDKNYMSMRPDDTLFDGIFAGGYVLNKSHFMPSYGFTLSRPEIKQLVAYIRKLCDCSAPGWSRDN